MELKHYGRTVGALCKLRASSYPGLRPRLRRGLHPGLKSRALWPGIIGPVALLPLANGGNPES